MKVLNSKSLMTGILTTALLGAIVLPVTAEEATTAPTPEAEAAVALYSKYIWRGFELSQDSLVIQPSISVVYKGFGVNLWGNLDTNQVGMESESFNWNETDFTLSYDGYYDMLGYGIGWIYYDVDGDGDTQEAYVSLSLDTILSPSLTFYKDIANFSGWYAALAIGHSFPINDTLALDLGAQIGYADDDHEYDTFHDGLLSASMSFPVGEYVTATPELYYSFPLSSDAEIALENNEGDDSFVYGGVAISFAF